MKARAEPAVELIASLEGPADPDAATAWAAEIERRVKRSNRGLKSLSPGTTPSAGSQAKYSDGEPYRCAYALIGSVSSANSPVYKLWRVPKTKHPQTEQSWFG